MKKLAIVLALSLAALTAFAHDHKKGDKEKSCDMAKGAAISVTGTVACHGDDCTMKAADKTYTICEMSNANLPKLASSGTVTVKGKLITCEGKEKLLIQSTGDAK